MAADTEQPDQQESYMHEYGGALTEQIIAGRTADIQMGWADPSQMEEALHALEEWGDHADAFMSIVWCEAVGWKE